MIGLFVILVVIGSLMLGGVGIAASIVFRVLLGLILLPFRLIGLILFLPLLILRGLIGAVVGLAMAPFFIVGIPLLLAGGIVAVVIFSLLTPLLPLLAICAVIWLLVKASARPRLI
jgi:hypothetical protein